MILLREMQEDVRILRENYKKLPWYQRWFFPQSLGNALDKVQDAQLASTSLLPVYQAFAQTYYRRSWFIVSWFNPILDVFACAGRFFPGIVTLKGPDFSPGTTEQVCEAYQAGLLEGDLAQVIFDALALNDGSSAWIINVLKVLKNAGLLTQANIEMLAENRQSREFVTALNRLYANGLLTGKHAQANFYVLLTLSDYNENLLALLQKEGITQAEFEEHIALCRQESSSVESCEEQIVNPTPLVDLATAKLAKVSMNITSTSFGLFQANTRESISSETYPIICALI